MHTFTNTYRQLDRDSVVTKFKPDAFYNARNFRILSNEELRSGAITNMDGNVRIFSYLNGYTSDYIIGAKRVRNKMIIFTTNNHGEGAGAGRIWKANLDSSITESSNFTLIANATLNFSQAHPIEDIILFYESETIQKLYWTDHNNNLLYCNIADPNLLSWTADQFEIVQTLDMSQPSLDQIVSGTIPVGMVQYAYRLYRLNGPATNFSPAGQMIPITKASIGVTDSREYEGSDALDDDGSRLDSGKGVRIKIEDIDTDFDRIEVVAIYYPSINGTPEIYEVITSPVSSTMYFTDDGAWDGIKYSLDEFTIINNPMKCKTLASEKNILFAGNVEQTEFDFNYDARAYRYRKSGSLVYTLLYDGESADFPLMPFYSNRFFINHRIDPETWYHYYDDTNSNRTVFRGMDNIPDTADLINPSNNIATDKIQTDTNSFKFQTDGETLGGEGLNVSYEFEANFVRIDSGTGSDKTYYTSSKAAPDYFDGINGFINNVNRRGWARDEIYRMGVIGFDGKGRHSPVKWISDIRMPNLNESDRIGLESLGTPGFIFNYNSPDPVDALTLQINFAITGLPDNVKYVQIVYVPREEADKTHLFQGPIGWMQYESNTLRPIHECTPAENGRNEHKRWMYMISPEIDFYKNFSPGADDYIDIIGEFAQSTENTLISGYGLQSIVTKSYRFYPFSRSNTRWFSVNSTSLITGYTNHDVWPRPENEFAGLKYSQTTEAGSSGSFHRGDFNTALLISLGSDLSLSGSTDPYTRGVVANYRRNLFGSQYGGYTYEDRSRNHYIPAGPMVAVVGGSASPIASWGDTFINYHDHQLVSTNQSWVDEKRGSNRNLSIIDMFPVETTVNLTYRMDDHYNRIRDLGADAYLLHETGNAEFTYDKVLNFSKDRIELSYGWSDLYQLNTVYMRKPDAKKYFPLPPDYNVEKTYDTQVSASMAKKGGEVIDPWTVFSANEYIDLESGYGPINKLISWNGNLLCWQDDAVGILSVLERSVVSDQAGKPTVLGTGEVLQRYDYLELESGLSTRKSIAVSNRGIYWYDNKRKKMSRFRGGIQDISVVSGMNSYFNAIDDSVGQYDNAGSIDHYHYGFVMAYNPEFKEVWFSIKKGLSIGKALVYNEVLDSFTGFTESHATYQFNMNNRFFTVKNATLYEENIGKKGRFYDSYYDSELSMIINPHGTTVVTFHNHEITSEVYDSADASVHTETVTSIKNENSYQDTGERSLASSNSRRLIRTWRLGSGRNSGDNARLRDNYLKTTLKFENDSDDKTIVMHDFVTLYSVPAESISNKTQR